MPQCRLKVSRRVHSWYERRLLDTAVAGRDHQDPVRLFHLSVGNTGRVFISQLIWRRNNARTRA